MRKRLFRIIRVIVALALLVAVVIVMNDRASVSKQLNVAPVPKIEVPREDALNRLQQAIRIETVSTSNPARMNVESFVEFSKFLEDSFPVLHNSPSFRRIMVHSGDDNHTLLYSWTGADPSADAILLMAHYDVVPIEPETRERWTHAPFSGEMDQGFIWGRGTLDAKNSALAMLEAISRLVKDSFQPTRTIYFSFGHDEEVGGTHGNQRVAEWMRSEGIRLEFVLDEGGCILKDFPGLEVQVALIGVAEKGFANVRLTAEIPDGGHSSMPPEQTAIEILSAAIDRISDHPLPRRMTDATESMFDYLGPEMPWPTRLAIANRWLFRPLIHRQLSATPSGNAMLRTTFAPTMIRGGVKDNVLPSRATATINIRPLPGDALADVFNHLKKTIDDDRISIEVVDPTRDASRTSNIDSGAFAMLHRSVKEIYPDTLVAPFVLVGGTDSSHFADIAKDIYRFIPSRLDTDDLKRIHGVDERISEEDYLDLIRFYVRFLSNSEMNAETSR